MCSTMGCYLQTKIWPAPPQPFWSLVLLLAVFGWLAMLELCWSPLWRGLLVLHLQGHQEVGDLVREVPLPWAGPAACFESAVVSCLC